MKTLHTNYKNVLLCLLVFGGVFLFFGGSAKALPQTLPDSSIAGTQPDLIYVSNVDSGGPIGDDSPTTAIKVYTKTLPASGAPLSVEVNIWYRFNQESCGYNSSTNAPDPYSLSYAVVDIGSTETASVVDNSVSGIWTVTSNNAVTPDDAAACHSYSVTIPNADFSASTLPNHVGYYVAEVNLSVCHTGSCGSATAYMTLSTAIPQNTTSAYIDFAAGLNSNEIPKQGDSNSNTLIWPFRASCTPGTPTIQWGDDDYDYPDPNTVQPNEPSIYLLVGPPGAPTSTIKIAPSPPGIGVTQTAQEVTNHGFSGSNQSVNTTAIPWVGGQQYEFVISGLTTDNGVSVQIPYDAGDFYLPGCQPNQPYPPVLGVTGAMCNASGITGWAAEPTAAGATTYTTAQVKVEFEVNGTVVGTTYTVGGTTSPTANTFSYPVPPGYYDGTVISVYAVTSGGTTGPGSANTSGTDPITLTGCPPPPDLGVNSATCSGGISGWASEGESSSTEVITVDIYADGPQGTGTLIGTTTNDGHGFPATNPSWNLSFADPSLTAYRTGSHSFYIYAINQEGGEAGPGIPAQPGGGAVYGPDPIGLVVDCGQYNYAPSADVSLSGGSIDTPYQVVFKDLPGLSFVAGNAPTSGCVNGVNDVTVGYQAYETTAAGTNYIEGSPGSFQTGGGTPGCIAENDVRTEYTYTITDPTALEAGDEFCMVAEVNPGSGWVDSAGNQIFPPPGGAVTSSADCVSIENQPFFKVYDSGISSGGDFGDSDCGAPGVLGGWYYNETTALDPEHRADGYGASTDLETQALSQIVGVGSAQGDVYETGPDSFGLAFSNQLDSLGGLNDPNSPTLGGNFGGTHCITAPAPPSTTQTLAPDTVDTSDPTVFTPGDTIAYTHTGNLTINANALIPNGTNIAIFNTGNVYITQSNGTGGLIYNTTGWTVSPQTNNIPSFNLVVTGGNIYIDPSVSELDGTYVAESGGASGEGEIYDCSDTVDGNNFAPMKANELYSDCNNQLYIVGSFEADQVNLMRTLGSLRDTKDNSSDENPQLGGYSVPCSNGNSNHIPICAAEIFNFSPELYLSSPAIESSTDSAGPHYDSITSLPPVL